MKYIFTMISISMMIAGLSQLSSCHNSVDIKTAQYAVNGQKLYKTHCQNCHGAKGEGLGKLYPPLTDQNFLAKHRNALACIIKNGLDQEIEVAGEKFNQKMPANPTLTNVDIAYILTYITTHFGDSNTLYSQEEVGENLKNCSSNTF